MARPNLGKLLASKAAKASATPASANLNASSSSAPARTRFAPSPTGTIHLGSLRTALFNYLLARSTKGQFILRLEDTDRTRLKPLAEQNIYDSLKWTNMHYDEGPIKQSERQELYNKEAQHLLDNGKAYRCFCSKERLDKLTQSARQLWPPSTASYDRKCAHLSKEESDKKAADGEQFVLRFKAPPKWPKFVDLLHGEVESQTQINQSDVRYDDFVILKSDGMPTYHLANVVDDSDMEITHVVRGEEWLPSTAKHVALYEAFAKRDPPNFIHIPLLTGEGGKKLSKRKSDLGILELAYAPHFIAPEALVNFVALLGWSPNSKRDQGSKVSEVLSLPELESQFSVAGLTRGNIQVDMSKLQYLNKRHFEKLINSDFEEAARRCQLAWPKCDLEVTKTYLNILRKHVSCVSDYMNHLETVFSEPEYKQLPKKLTPEEVTSIVQYAIEAITKEWDPEKVVAEVVEKFSKRANWAMRYALVDGKPGTSILEVLELLGKDDSLNRLRASLQKVAN